ncbi:PAS fold family protein [Enterobacter bugandensis]|uniref:PAS fold family protein n=1 Tax=Enterobacter bugandensis TaxID=881260 RepID=UPI002074C481|nr:PAS fold family protein [Enterobacter bugandensis]MCM7239229.1 PAS fold family protein [Enterobacter bugandensis]MCM7319073.1 PAS fold family protein [Enterobacter bugandensis]MCM7354600.1 PAS fold family protein [Enterobacter bugandensis]
MHLRDPKDLLQSSQSLDDVINHFNAVYKDSPLPFCIRDQFRNTVYKNDAYSDFFHPLSKPFSGASFDSDEVELDLSTIELEAFVMGADTAICRTFNFNGEYYQLRVEIRSIKNKAYAFWLINYFPDYQALFHTSNRIKSAGFDFDLFLSGLTTKKMITLCFSILGFQLHTMSQYLGVSEKAISSRLSSVKNGIAKHFADYDDFRFYCLKTNLYEKARRVVLKIMNVKPMLKK